MHTHSEEVNSNTLGLCALHQSGAVCTKAANPETEAWRCRRRAERTRFVLFGSTTVTLAAGITGKMTHGSWTCRFNTPWLVCGLSSPAVARILLGLGSEMSRRGACRIHCLSEIRWRQRHKFPDARFWTNGTDVSMALISVRYGLNDNLPTDYGLYTRFDCVCFVFYHVKMYGLY